MSTMLEEIVETRVSDNPGESSHIVLHVDDSTTPQAYVLRARIEGFPVTALCGYQWVPKQDPTPLPVCGKCLDIYKNSFHDDRDQLPEA